MHACSLAHVFVASFCLSFLPVPVLLAYECSSFASTTRGRFLHLLPVFCGELRVLKPLEKQATPYQGERATRLPCTS